MSDILEVLDKMRNNVATGMPFNLGIGGADSLYADLSKCYMMRTHTVNGETVPAPLSYLPSPNYFFINSLGIVTMESRIRSHDVFGDNLELSHMDAYRIRTCNVFKSRHDAELNLEAIMK